MLLDTMRLPADSDGAFASRPGIPVQGVVNLTISNSPRRGDVDPALSDSGGPLASGIGPDAHARLPTLRRDHATFRAP